jgi:hypothetical protein
MKTAIQQAIKEVADLWGSPNDNPNYPKIFEVLESKLEMEKQQIEDANIYGWRQALDESVYSLDTEQYYNETFKTE